MNMVNCKKGVVFGVVFLATMVGMVHAGVGNYLFAHPVVGGSVEHYFMPLNGVDNEVSDWAQLYFKDVSLFFGASRFKRALKVAGKIGLGIAAGCAIAYAGLKLYRDHVAEKQRMRKINFYDDE
jgi:hypothetical protein